MKFSFENKFGHLILTFIQNYNHQKYWRRRAIVVNPNSKIHIMIRLYYLYYIKKVDAYHNCSFGTNLGSGTDFEEPPHLPHGPKGIIVGHDLKIGKKVILYHNVTLAHGGSVIGDNVMFSTGSVLLSGRNIGDNVKVGANAVIIEDIPEGATVVLSKPKIIVHCK